MKKRTEKELIEFVKKWTCWSADGSHVIDEYEGDAIRKFFKISIKHFKEEE